jgi:predicted transposase/invertase (TIGR01784 family)
MSGIDNIHNNFFQKVLSEIANARAFLKFILPATLQDRLDFTEMSLDPTSYVSEQFKASFSDLVLKCRTKAEELPVDIYVLFEHKSYQDKGVLAQLLRYMSLMWQTDIEANKPLRVIVPIVFYHGAGTWQIPTQFIEQFAVTEEWKPFLLNFSYILFDVNAWDWQAESSQPLRENVFLLSAMMLMKAAYSKDLELVRQMFRLWHQIGFVQEKERINFLLIYVAETQDISIANLEKMAEETKLVRRTSYADISAKIER